MLSEVLLNTSTTEGMATACNHRIRKQVFVHRADENIWDRINKLDRIAFIFLLLGHKVFVAFAAFTVMPFTSRRSG